MEIPNALQEAMDRQAINLRQSDLVNGAQTISLRYRTQRGEGERLLTEDNEAVAYALSRMPATFGAVSAALEQAIAAAGCSPQTLLDAGAGTGSASWVADGLLELKSITCLERETAMMNTGRTMMEYGSPVLRAAEWIQCDLVTDDIRQKADLVIASYVLNEMSEQGSLIAATKLWGSTEKLLLLVEPGTPAAFSNLIKVRRALLVQGAHIAAPCPHEGECFKADGDWCHFAKRVSRSRLHRQLKGGEAPFEDEKFFYLAFTRNKCTGSVTRVLRHPQVRGGHMMLEVCTVEGIKNLTLSKKDGERYRKARKAKCGDTI